MRTPNIYTQSLKAGVVTPSMMGESLYSFNKRAKNYRDRVREYKYELRHSPYWKREYIQQSLDAAEDKMQEYYRYKDYLLSQLRPTQIHKCERWNSRTEECFNEYYLLYEVGGYSFHHPIEERDLSQYSLEVVELPTDFTTEGAEIEDLLSVQFSMKIVNGLRNGTLSIAA